MKNTWIYAALLGTAAMLAATPGQAATGTFTVNGDTIAYEVTGSGPPMLLIHGFPLSYDLFDKQRAFLSNSYTVITPSLPGFGQSTTKDSKQTIKHYAVEMLGLLDSLHIPTAIIGGHSMGGQVVLDMYRRQPQRFTGMILFDTNPQAANLIEQAEWPGYGRMALAMGSASIAPPVAAVMVTGDAVAKYPDMQTDIEAEVSQAQPVGVAGGANALVTRMDYTAMLTQISVPTLVVVGRDDAVYPLAISQALAAAIPGSTLAVIPGVAHASMFGNAAAVNHAIAAWASATP